MPCRIICGIFVLFVLTNAQRNRSGRRHPWDAPPSDNLIDIDVETDRYNTVGFDEVSGSGSGVDNTDDEDLHSSGSGSGDGAVPDVQDVDYTPKANAGPDIIKYMPENYLTLCGNSSYDDKRIDEYFWYKKPSSPYARLTDERTVCVKVSGMQVGNYTFTLVVTDSAGNKASDDVKVTVLQESPQLTPCQQLRESSKRTLGTYVPRCKEDGSYDSLQCRGHPGTGNCWCVDTSGREIPSTAMQPPRIPDCEDGSNLPPCVYSLVKQHRGRQLGSFRPRCTLEGLFEDVQCTGSVCYCVDSRSGVKIPGTESSRGLGVPDCDGPVIPGKEVSSDTHKVNKPPPEPKTTSKPSTAKPVPEATTKINVNIEQEEDQEMEEDPADANDSGGQEQELDREMTSAAHLMTQPGILAAVIGGSVVLLLCAILLVMFIVYRMRKKDEGSYALDEPKKTPNYSYQRAPDKEFYA